MKSQNQSSPLKIKDAPHAAVFVHPVQLPLLFACAKEEQSLSQLHRRLGLSLPKLHYHVRKLLALKLVALSRVEPRGGRPINYYRAVAQAYLVPQSLLPYQPSEDWISALRRSLRDAYREVEDLSFLFYAGADGSPSVRGVSEAARSRPSHVQDISVVLHLTAAQRASLARDMIELVERYARAASGRNSERFLVYAAFAPLREDSRPRKATTE